MKNTDEYTIDERRNIIYGYCIWAITRRLISADDKEIDLIWNNKRRLVFVFDEKKAYIDHIDWEPPIQHDPSYYRNY